MYIYTTDNNITLKGRGITVAKNTVLTTLKGLYSSFVDDSGNIRVVPVGKIDTFKLSDTRIALLQDVYRLVMKTSIITQETRLYISNTFITIKGVNELMNDGRTGSDIVEYNNTQCRINNDKNKLDKIFGSSFLFNITEGLGDVAQYQRDIIGAFEKYSNTGKLRDEFAIKVDDSCMNTEISDADWEDFISVLMPYSREQMRFISEQLDKKCCGYFNYLLSGYSTYADDKRRLDRLLELIKPSMDD